MIYANIENDKYDFNSPLFKCAIAFLKRPDLNMLEPGRIDLDNGVYASVQEYETKDENECRFETHEKYFDIQFVVSGEEYIGICDRKEAKVSVPYDENKDITFYADPDNYGKILLTGGDYVIVSPSEAHKPKCRVTESTAVKKIVIKVPI